jgi:nucleotide-binding universal stress UspA family protein
MDTILVPVDFSPTAKNAAEYAIHFAKQVGAKQVLLYNACQAPVMADPMLPAMQLLDIDTVKKGSEGSLEHLKQQLLPLCEDKLILDIKSEFALLINGVEELCSKGHISMVIMGITGGSAIEETLIGSNTIALSKHIDVPVIIVPKDAGYKPVKSVLFACDFKDTSETTPVDAITTLLDATSANLHILHVEGSDKDYSSDTVFESIALETLLPDYHKEYHFVNGTDLALAISTFAENHAIDLIIAVPKKHGFFEGLFHKSLTKKLAFHSHIPLIVMHP